MTKTTTPDSELINDQVTSHHAHRHGGQFYTELARISGGLLAGVVALMAFLLAIASQRPHNLFSWAFYSAVVLLGLNLVAYVVGHVLKMNVGAKVWAAKASADDGKDSPILDDNLKRARKWLKVVRGVQLVLFVASIVAVVTLAVATANYFFAPVATPTTTTSPQ